MPYDLGGGAPYELKHQHKLTTREVNTTTAACKAIPTYLKWSEAAIIFDRADHPIASRNQAGFRHRGPYRG
jgi:hypothetical protein